MTHSKRKIVVTGATGFIGRPLVEELLDSGETVVATSRRERSGRGKTGLSWRVCDVFAPETLVTAFDGAQIIYYLVHHVGEGRADLLDAERRAATNFARAAERAGAERIVFLGATAPARRPSAHLKSRLEVGEILRSGSVPTAELRSAIVVGHGSASWKLTEDLALRLPRIAVRPTWMMTRVAPVALDDIIRGLASAADMPLEESAWYDLPGPELLTGWEILCRVAKVRGRTLRGITLPFITPWLAAFILQLWTDVDYTTLRELVPGFREDLLPTDDRFWSEIGHSELVSFDEAVRRAFQNRLPAGGTVRALLTDE